MKTTSNRTIAYKNKKCIPSRGTPAARAGTEVKREKERSKTRADDTFIFKNSLGEREEGGM